MGNQSFFGLNETAARQGEDNNSAEDLSVRLANFPSTKSRRIDTEAVDAAAAKYGFISREPAGGRSLLRRRRVPPKEKRPNNMGIRLSDAEKERFVNFADRHRLPNYADAIVMLLDIAEGKIPR